MVRAPFFLRFSTVLCSRLRLTEISSASEIPPHAAFIASGVPSSPNVPRIRTGWGYSHGFGPKLFLMQAPPSLIVDGASRALGRKNPASAGGAAWWAQQDSNLHGSPHQILSLARLPFRHGPNGAHYKPSWGVEKGKGPLPKGALPIGKGPRPGVLRVLPRA